MCGICGYINKKDITEDKIIYDMCSKLTKNEVTNYNIYLDYNVALRYERRCLESNIGNKSKALYYSI